MKLFDLDKNDRFLTDFSQPGTPAPSVQPEDPVTDGSGTPVFEFDAPRRPDPLPTPPRRRVWPVYLVVVLLLVIAGCVWVRWLNPYAEEARVRGYVVKVEKRGLIFKNYEGEIVTEGRVADHTYRSDLQVCVPDDSLGRLLQSYQGSGIPVELGTERYYGTLPWRGET
ncbi:MAG: hypothetical protein K2H87_04475, partial [Duncaniella sp.]|nr:hypothetical protein [Duncaniella sp.]